MLARVCIEETKGREATIDLEEAPKVLVLERRASLGFEMRLKRSEIRRRRLRLL